MNLGFAMRPQPIARVPQSPHDAGPEPRGAAGALIGAVERDALGRQRIDAAFVVVARDLLQARVDHRRHTADRQRRLRDVGRDDDPPSRSRRRRAGAAILLRRRPSSREAEPGRACRAGDATSPLSRSSPRSLARPAGSTARCPRCAAARRRAQPRSVSPGAYSIVSGCSVPGTSMIGQPPRNRRDRFRIERCRHHDDPQIRSRQPRLLRQREAEIGVHASLVKFIDDDRGDVAQQRILLEVGGQDAFGDDEEARVRGELPLETDVPADFAADGPAALVGDAPRHRSRRDAPRLQQQHAPAIDERRRHSRGLAGARRRHQHRGAMTIERLANARQARNQRAGPAARSIIKAYRQGYSAFANFARRVEKHPGT